MASKIRVVVLVLVVISVTSTTTSALFPSSLSIYNVTDPKIQYLGRFAVEQYIKKGESHLYFKEVFKGEEYFVPGHFLDTPDKYYEVQLQAINCSQFGAMGNYTACVIKLGNTTDPTTGLSYILKSFFTPNNMPLPSYGGICHFFH